MVSCGKDSGTEIPPEPITPNNSTEQTETVTVSFAMHGDVSTSEEPLSKVAREETESNDLYGITVYYNKGKGDYADAIYGGGLFDNIADMKISLLTGYKYAFRCTLVKDGKNIISSGYNQKGEKYFKTPFCNFILNNSFFLEPNSNYPSYPYGGIDARSDCINTLNGYYPSVDRYYGATDDDYIPTKDGGIVNIELVRSVFGVKFNITGVSDGSLSYELSTKATYDGYGQIICTQSDITTDISTDGVIYEHHDPSGCWINKVRANTDYPEIAYVHLIWKRANGITENLPPEQVTLKRNVMNIINIRLRGKEVENSLNLNVENIAIGEANINLDINAGDITDTPINPTE